MCTAPYLFGTTTMDPCIETRVSIVRHSAAFVPARTAKQVILSDLHRWWYCNHQHAVQQALQIPLRLALQQNRQQAWPTFVKKQAIVTTPQPPHDDLATLYWTRHVDEIRRIVFATSLSLHSITIKHSPLGHEQTRLIAITGLQGVRWGDYHSSRDDQAEEVTSSLGHWQLKASSFFIGEQTWWPQQTPSSHVMCAMITNP
jgi:hypothetical protein